MKASEASCNWKCSKTIGIWVHSFGAHAYWSARLLERTPFGVHAWILKLIVGAKILRTFLVIFKHCEKKSKVDEKCCSLSTFAQNFNGRHQFFFFLFLTSAPFYQNSEKEANFQLLLRCQMRIETFDFSRFRLYCCINFETRRFLN